MSENNTVALVTGASAGLGAEFCRQLAPRCDVIIAVARREERLHQLAAELAPQAEVHCVSADLTTVEGVTAVLESLRQQGPPDYLVNNAGAGTCGPFAAQTIDSQRAMLALHIDAAVTLCRAAIPFMRERGGGSIINVSSLGALLPGRDFAVYGASKAFLNHFSLALSDELAGSGIQVQALCPGFTATEFHAGAGMRGFARERVPESMWMQPAPVVATSLAALGGDACVVVPGEDNLALARAALQRQLAALTPGEA